jgi:hypothetical protein
VNAKDEMWPEAVKIIGKYFDLLCSVIAHHLTGWEKCGAMPIGNLQIQIAKRKDFNNNR